ncbi:hypothetical protein [Methylorubrum zatmanii]
MLSLSILPAGGSIARLSALSGGGNRQFPAQAQAKERDFRRTISILEVEFGEGAPAWIDMLDIDIQKKETSPEPGASTRSSVSRWILRDRMTNAGVPTRSL